MEPITTSVKGSNKKKRKRQQKELLAKKEDKNSSNDGTNSSKKFKKKKKDKRNHGGKEQQHQQQQQLQQLSLASRLKRLRGTAGTTPLPPKWSQSSSLSLSSSSSPSEIKFLSPNNGDQFVSCLNECYRGFCWDSPEEMMNISATDTMNGTIHENFSNVFSTMDENGLFLYDVVQPGGKRSSYTFVKRTLVGEPGSTYKYLGLRLFSHPWSPWPNDNDDDNDDNNRGAKRGKNSALKNLTQLGYKAKSARALLQMGKLNQQLITRTEEKLAVQIKPYIEDGLVGSTNFTITLINRMEPTSIKKDLKLDNVHGLGKASVSWHKDSGLQDFSSIAVYHTLEEGSGSSNDDQNNVPWKVGLRVADPNSSTPALSVDLPSGACYYLLDDFNHQHEHAVISGTNSLRYSSTHRVARDGSGTWQFIRDKSKTVTSSKLCSSLLSSLSMEESASHDNINKILLSYSSAPLQKKLVKEVRSFYQLMAELEFEWIRMWNVQGQCHADLHPAWHRPIEIMKQTFLKLKNVTAIILEGLKKSAEESLTDRYQYISEDLFDVVIEGMESRDSQRATWKQRLKDKIFKTMPKETRPIQCNTFDGEDDEATCDEIRKWRSVYVHKKGDNKMKSANTNDRKGKNKLNSMTKKERKKVASNWERMKCSIKKK